MKRSLTPTMKKSEKGLFTLLCESLWPLYAIARLVGILPLKIERKQGEIVLNPQNRDWLYFMFYMGLYTVASAYTIFAVMQDEKNYRIVPHVLIIVMSFIIIFQMFLTIIFGFILRGLIIEFLQHVSEIDRSLMAIGVDVNYQSILKRTYAMILTMGISALIRSSAVITTIKIDILQQTTLFMSTLIKSLTKYSFILFVMPVSVRFARINLIIESFYKKEKYGKAPDESEMLRKLYVLCRLHYKLCNVVRILNRAFAFQLLFSLGVTLSDILFQSYYLYVALAVKFELVTVMMIVCPILWLIDEIMEVFLLVRACAGTCENANSTSVILHELRNNKDSLKLESHIQMYSLQMLHQKVSFSALGFFDIDYTLLYSIVGSVTTYLVIFIQFDKTPSAAAQNETSLVNATM